MKQYIKSIQLTVLADSSTEADRKVHLVMKQISQQAKELKLTNDNGTRRLKNSDIIEMRKDAAHRLEFYAVSGVPDAMESEISGFLQACDLILKGDPEERFKHRFRR